VVGGAAPRAGHAGRASAKTARAPRSGRASAKAARATRSGGASAKATRSGATRPGGTRATAARAPRAGTTAASARADHPRRIAARSAPSVPRRISGPIRRDRAAPARAKAAPRPRVQTVTQRAGAFLRSLPDHALIDRLVRSQAWILVLGVMLAGIVAMQVEVLKLGANVGRSIERSSSLQTRNQLLRASVASLSDDARIERLAAGMGMIMPAPGAAAFVPAAASGAVQRAIANIHAPDPTTFLASTTSNGAVASNGNMSSADGAIAANPPLQSGSASGSTYPASSASTATSTPSSQLSATSTAASTLAPQQSATSSTTSTASQPQSATNGG
jgi:hypothetical protein